MKKTLRILHLEDEPDYSDLVRSLLETHGLQPQLVLASNRADFEAALSDQSYDLILADYRLPAFDGLQALKYVRERTPETPFLLVSGTIGEQAAIESLKAGATDYVLKHWPERLVPAILRAVQESHERQQRVRAETELMRHEKYFRALTENSLDVLTILSREAVFLYNTPSVKRLLGYEPNALIGKSAFDLVHLDDLTTVVRAFNTALHQPERSVVLDFRFQHQDGSWRHLETVGQSRLSDPDIAGVVVNVRDITDRKRAETELHESETVQRRLEHQLRQSQKMEAIGQLAGGVAHDFNNILTVIHGHASLLLAGGSLADASARSAQQIVQAAERAASLTRQLLTFSRRQVMQPQPLDMNEAVCNMTQLLSRILGEDIALQLNYYPQPALVQADASMIEQVLLNLAINSRDAMPNGGQLAIRISVQDVDERYSATHTEARVGRFVRLSVADTGCGISPESVSRIFEPFFTTKEVGKGTGLGLATVYGIVKQHQGWLEVETEPGKGTMFRVFLPCTGTALDPAKDHTPERAVRGGTETILVVEDEAPVRELVCNLLTAHGYKVLHAESGVRALEVWRTSKDAVDLVLTDLVMPDRMNGRELAEKLWAERPTLKVIFTSGYSADVVGADFVLQRGLNYLQKPYHPQKLALSIRDCLDALN